MKEAEYSVGMFSPHAKVRVTNKQNCAQFESLEGYVSEEEARAASGNVWRDTYDYRYDGLYGNRGKALDRLNRELESTKKKLEDIEFAIKVTKKKVWEKVKNEN